MPSMPTAEPSKTARVEARIAPDVLAIVRQAASLQGRSVSEFVVAAARDAAHRTVDEAQNLKLSIKDQRRFVELLLKPPTLAPAMLRARKSHAQLIKPAAG